MASYMYSSSGSKRFRSSSPPREQAHAQPTLAHAPHLYIQAHEATLIRGRDELAAQTEGTGSRCLQWSDVQIEGEPVWIDRYDVLNLLGALPMHLPRSPGAEPSSPTTSVGFSDLPSDSEEMFYFSAEERDEITRKKKRRRLEEGRNDRMRALEAEEEASRPAVETEPSETQLALMRKLDKTLQAAQEPALLEMRILANHGSDPRFSFLRKGGQWREEWEQIRRQSHADATTAASKSQSPKGKHAVETGGTALVGYGSDDDSGAESEQAQAPEPGESVEESDVSQIEGTSVSSLPSANGDAGAAEEKAKRRAAKVAEWAQKRKAARKAEDI